MGDGRAAAFTIGTTTQVLVNDDNASNSVTFSGILPDAHGHVQIDTAVDTAIAHLGAVELSGDFIVTDTNQPASIFFDFGSGYATGGNWNNISSHAADTTAKITDAVDSLGQPTTVDLFITDAFGGSNNVGEQSNDAGFPTSAQRDSFFLIGSDTGQMRIEGLDPEALFDFTFFGSRQTDGAPAGLLSTQYQIGGQTGDLAVKGNTSNTLTFFDVESDINGQVLIDFQTTAGANIAYVGVMQITQVVPEPSAIMLTALALFSLAFIGRSGRSRHC